MPELFNGVFKGKKVLVTGHTGFKGAWLSFWLGRLGARVVGYALEPPTDPNLFEILNLEQEMVHIIGDVRDADLLERTVSQEKPDMVFHLAAQPLVRLSYLDPRTTYETNIMGTFNLLEAVRKSGTVRACLLITSDKCYENHEWVYAYRENDPMGGYDPYSSSKGCAEILAAAYRRSFLNPDNLDRHGVSVATARAGNVIGGGDWAQDRLIPDCIRMLSEKKTVKIRNPGAVRPWQHVLEPLSGYLWLTARMWSEPALFAGSWNFGPNSRDNVSVEDLVKGVLDLWGSSDWKPSGSEGERKSEPHETTFLRLDCTKAHNMLHWFPLYDIKKSLKETVAWYRAQMHEKEAGIRRLTMDQIEQYVLKGQNDGVAWALTGGSP